MTRRPWLCAVLVAAALVVPAGAEAFRYVTVGDAAPALALLDQDGRGVQLPAVGRVNVIVFWRPGQQLSEGALADLSAVAAALGPRGVQVFAVAEAGSDPGLSRGRTERGVRFLVDRDRRAGEAYGVIVFPSLAVVDSAGKLRAYLPSRNGHYRELVETYTLGALGDIPEAELGPRLARLGAVYGRNAEAAQTAFRQGVAQASERRWEEASRSLAQALALEPGLTAAHLELGYIRLEVNEPAQALHEFELVLSRQPGSPTARVGVGIARIRLGQVGEGIRILEDAMTLNPEPVRALYELGRAYESRGDFERAVHRYRWAYQKLFQGRK